MKWKKMIGMVGMIVCMFFQKMVAFSQENTQPSIVDLTTQAGYNVKHINPPVSSIAIESETGTILWQDNIDKPHNPASISKLMTLYLVYEAIQRGELRLDTVIQASEKDEKIGKIHALSNNKIVSGVNYPVSELIKMTLVPSSNVATLMLANALEKDPDAFLDKMNQKAKELGMEHTVFHNATGAEASAFNGYYAPTRYDNHLANQTTARDLAILTHYFMKNFPNVLEYTKDTTITTMINTPYTETFHSYNHSLPTATYYAKGVDGLKTGSSPSAGFNIVMTAKREAMRVIVVILGVGDWQDQRGEYYRHPFANAVLEKAYADYEYRELLTPGEYDEGTQHIQLTHSFYGVIKKQTDPDFTVKNNMLYINNGLDTVSPLINNGAPTSITKVKNQQGILGNGDAVEVDAVIIGSAMVIVVCLAILAGKVLRSKRR